jgi:hypothetical protein
MDYEDYERGFSAGAKSEHDRNVAALMDYEKDLWLLVKGADDPHWQIAQAEAVEDYIALLRRAGTDEIPIHSA